jgi:hypothetical protein
MEKGPRDGESMHTAEGATVKLSSRGLLSLHPQEKGMEGRIWVPHRVGARVGGLLECFFALSSYFLSWGSSRESVGVALT